MKCEKIKAEEERAKAKSIIAAIGDRMSIQDRDLTMVSQNETLSLSFGDHRGEKCYQTFDHSNFPCDPCPVLAALKNGAVRTTEITHPHEKGYFSCFEVKGQ